MGNYLRLIFGIVLTVFGLVMTGGVLVGISDGDSTFASDFGPWLILGFVPLAVGIGLIISFIKKKNHKKTQQIENRLLKFAQKNNGHITAAELAMETSLNFKQAETILEDFVKQGIATRKISDSGIFVYQFPMVSDSEKSNAKGIYEL
ncbi:hypothetical protein [Metabacillus malikii]|uniref:Transcriptional regulator n=1 Tax=Metabacillus malikii TaxID=1504265 RepID=A0ABT9ZK11_9BACI|nr:hypothetical protein [Metabacillus malikii]MDQ0232219.1 putative transcriptional regulator [Metabacillus malikii]